MTGQLSVSNRKMLWILLAQASVIAPHVTRLPFWIIVVSILSGVWGYYAVAGKLYRPGRIILMLLVSLVILAIINSYGTLINRDACIGLLMIMLSFKVLEFKTDRDIMLFVFMGYFLVITNFLFSQSIAMASYMLLVSLLLTSTLVMLNRHDAQLNLKQNLKLAATLLMQSVPIMLVLFVLFPRLPGPVWSMPSDKTQSRTGISDRMSPGSISQLIKSDAVAFRASFINNRPENSSLYWRGPVLWNYDGRTWFPGFTNISQNPGIASYRGKLTNYSLTIEPHQLKWVFALDVPVNTPGNTTLNKNFSLVTRSPIKKRTQFNLQSAISYRIGESITNQVRNSALQLPRNVNPQTRQWVSQLQRSYKRPEQQISQVLNYFNKQDFIYTLNPPLLGRHAIDEFLFQTRKGFCEHYAGSFVYIMRLLNIPARVVLGYQGGEYNKQGGYLIIRQSDAHAWTEVWLQNRGWVRIDPTSAVAPERVERGIDAAIPAFETSGSFLRSRNPILRSLLMSWDAMNYKWHKWVLGYDADKQSGLLEKLGIDTHDWKSIAISLFTGLGIILLIGFIWINLKKFRYEKDQTLRLYALFCQRLTKAGFMRQKHEGPRDFANRVTRQRPDLKEDINLITRFYIQLRYGCNTPEKLFIQFKTRVRKFHPKQTG